MARPVALPRPTQVSHLSSPDGVQLSWCCRSWTSAFIPAGFVVASLAIGVGNGLEFYDENLALGTIFFVGGLVGACISAWYFAAATMNRTKIRVENSSFSFHRGPFRTKPIRTYDVSTIEQLSVRKNVRGSTSSRKQSGYRLQLTLDSGLVQRIDDHLEPNVLLYAEQELEYVLWKDDLAIDDTLARRSTKPSVTPQDIQPMVADAGSSQLGSGPVNTAPTPPGFVISDALTKTDITYSWRSLVDTGAHTVAYIFFLVLANLTFGSFLIALLVTTVFGFKLITGALAALFNTTTICADRKQVTFRHGPIPLVGHKNQTLNVSDILQLYSRPKSALSSTSEVRALSKNGDDVRLLSRLDRDEALFLEAAIEHRIGIIDAFVPGSHER